VAYEIIKAIFNHYPLAMAVKVRLKKPWAPMGRHMITLLWKWSAPAKIFMNKTTEKAI
jgi:dihydroneopterin aldolase